MFNRKGKVSWMILFILKVIIPTFIIFIIYPVVIGIIFKDLGKNDFSKNNDICVSPFSVSDYLSRIEEEHLSILRNRKKQDMTIILWFGLEGIRVNEDGSVEWVKREENKKLLPAYMNFQPSCLNTTPACYQSIYAQNMAQCCNTASIQQLMLSQAQQQMNWSLINSLERVEQIAKDSVQVKVW